MRKSVSCWGVAASMLVAAGTARAGGFDIPDEGTEPLGRGGAFTAKADSPLALYYNVAGLARQRGTRLTADVNLIFHDIAFTRAGSYPDDPATPFPTMHDGSAIFPLP